MQLLNPVIMSVLAKDLASTFVGRSFASTLRMTVLNVSMHFAITQLVYGRRSFMEAAISKSVERLRADH